MAKIKVNAFDMNCHPVVTNRRDHDALGPYDRYACRGQAENSFNVLNNDLALNRLSWHRFSANQFRLLLHGLA